MPKIVDRSLAERLRGRLTALYGEHRVERLLERLFMCLGRYGIQPTPDAGLWSESDCVLITYGDSICDEGKTPLASLNAFAREHLREAVDTIHILPFCPWTSDDGFSISDYSAIDPQLGSWRDVRNLAPDFKLMADLVLNHCSRSHQWFKDFCSNTAPGRDFFIAIDDPELDLSQVVRPRSHPLLTEVATRTGPRRVWTTFSEDQVDLDFANPDVLFAFIDVLLWYIANGAHIIRLDAIAYLWKRIGTPCIHLPETHEVVRLLRDIVDHVAPGVLLLTETNVPHQENVSYFGDGDEAHMVYNFSLPPLLLHALHRSDASVLSDWAAQLPSLPAGQTFLNFTASHDGVGMRPLEGLVPTEDVQELLAAMRDRGGRVSMKRNADGSESPYELNITWYSACSGPAGVDSQQHIERFLLTQAIMLTLPGIPAIYIHSLLGTPNDLDGLAATGRNRSINRRKFTRSDLDALLGDSRHPMARVFSRYRQMLALRRHHSAFHPDAAARIHRLDPRLFIIERQAADERIVAIHNMSGEAVDLSADTIADLALGDVEILSGSGVDLDAGLTVPAYAAAWLL